MLDRIFKKLFATPPSLRACVHFRNAILVFPAGIVGNRSKYWVCQCNSALPSFANCTPVSIYRCMFPVMSAFDVVF